MIIPDIILADPVKNKVLVDILHELYRNEESIKIIDSVPDALTRQPAIMYNRTNDTLYICDTDKWYTFTNDDGFDLPVHGHNDLYYTEDETDALLSGKSGTGHIHDDRYYTETELDAGQLDTRYYTENETDALLILRQSRRRAFTPVTTTYTALSTDDIIQCNGTFTVSLPTASGISGRIYHIKNVGTGTITIDPDGTETIDGELTQTLNAWESISIYSGGTNWRIF